MKKLIALTAALTLFAAVSCSDGKTGSSDTSTDSAAVTVTQTAYKEDSVPLPDDFASLKGLGCFDGEVSMVYRSENAENSYLLAHYDSNLALVSSTELFNESVNELAVAFAPDGSFAVLIIFADYDKYPIEDYEDYFANAVIRFELRRYDSQGTLTDTTELDSLDDYFTFGQSFFSEFKFWGDKLVLGLQGTDSFYLLLDGSGNVTDELSTNTNYAFTEDSNGKFIMSAFEDYAEMDAPSLSYPSEAIAFGKYTFRTGDIYAGTGDFRFYAELGDGIYGITQGGESVKVLDYNTSRVISSEVRSIVNIGEGRFAYVGCTSSSGRFYFSLLTVRPDDYVEERQKVIFGVQFNDSTLASEYNRKSDRFEVETKVYADDDALKSAILTNEAPDVYNFWDISSVYKFANFGALADMYELSAQYGGLTSDDILDNVVTACEYKGGLYCLPNAISINARFADRSVIGKEHQNWTLDEFFEIAENMPEGMYLGDQWSFHDSKEVFQFLVSQNLTQWIDFERATCSFDSDKFVHTLEFCRDVNLLPDYREIAEGLSDEEMRLNEEENIYRLRKGESLLGSVYIHDIDDLRCEAAHYMYELDEVTLLSPPSDDDSGMISFGNGIYSVLSCGNSPEGGWDFLNFLLSYDKQTEFNHGFFSRKDSFEHNARYRMEQANETAESGLTTAGYNNYYIEYDPTITEEQYQEFCDYLATCTHIFGGYSDIESILMEEYDKFIGGEMTAQQCAEHIQDRVSIYLGETS